MIILISQEAQEEEFTFTTPFVSKGKDVPPPWLRSDESKSSLPTSSGNVSEGATATTVAGTEAIVPRYLLYTRIINLILSVCMILVSVLALLTTQTATTGVLACYVVVFSCLLCCFETHLKQISKIIALNFGFMYDAKSRSVFMLFIGQYNDTSFCILPSIIIYVMIIILF